MPAAFICFVRPSQSIQKQRTITVVNHQIQMPVMDMSTAEQALVDLLRAGQSALGRGAWGEARACFAEALRA